LSEGTGTSEVTRNEGNSSGRSRLVAKIALAIAVIGSAAAMGAAQEPAGAVTAAPGGGGGNTGNSVDPAGGDGGGNTGNWLVQH
jgi:hypothetical protein